MKNELTEYPIHLQSIAFVKPPQSAVTYELHKHETVIETVEHWTLAFCQYIQYSGLHILALQVL